MKTEILRHAQCHTAKQPRHGHGIDTGLESGHQCEGLHLMQADIGNGGVSQDLGSVSSVIWMIYMVRLMPGRNRVRTPCTGRYQTAATTLDLFKDRPFPASRAVRLNHSSLSASISPSRIAVSP